MREENDAGKTIVTTDDLTALFVRLGSDWTAREREAIRWKDRKGASHAEEMAGAFETMTDCMPVMAQPVWTKAGAAAYLMRMADSCRENAAGLREKMGDDFDLALLKDAEARAYRQAAWTLAGRPVRPDTPAVLRCCLIEPDAPSPRLFAPGYCDDNPGELEAAFRAFEAYYKISRENDRLLETGGHTLLATSAGGDVPSVRGQDGEPLLYGKTLLYARLFARLFLSAFLFLHRKHNSIFEEWSHLLCSSFFTLWAERNIYEQDMGKQGRNHNRGFGGPVSGASCRLGRT